MPSSRYYKFKEVSREERIKKLKVLFLSIGACGLFLGAIWVIFLSPIFKIKNIDIISDNAYLESNDIKKIISNITPLGLTENLLVVSNSRLKSELAAIFPAITDISVKKKLLNTLTVNFKKRIPIGIWCHPTRLADAPAKRAVDQPKADNCYYFDKEGIVFSQAPETEGSLILKITDLSKNDISLGGKVLGYNRIHFVISFTDKIDTINKFKILEFKINPRSSVDFEAITDKNWSIYLDDTQDPKMAVNNLFTILDEAVEGIGGLDYIDLRIPDRIFYCQTNKPCAILTK